MPDTRKAELDTIATNVQRLITASVKNGLWMRSAINEQPSKEAIGLSIPWIMVGVKTSEERDYVLDTVYPKLRKNGILAKLR